MVFQIGIIVRSVLGLGIERFMTLVAFGFINPQHSLVPAFRRLDEGACLRIVHSRNARVLGPPNAILKIASYGQLIAVSVWFPTSPPILLCVGLITAVGVVILSMYQATSLFRIRNHCIPCFASHIIDVLLMILFLCASSE